MSKNLDVVVNKYDLILSYLILYSTICCMRLMEPPPHSSPSHMQHVLRQPRLHHLANSTNFSGIKMTLSGSWKVYSPTLSGHHTKLYATQKHWPDIMVFQYQEYKQSNLLQVHYLCCPWEWLMEPQTQYKCVYTNVCTILYVTVLMLSHPLLLGTTLICYTQPLL